MPRKAKQSDWPFFASGLLDSVAAAFRLRRKAIRYQAGVSCSREICETAAGASERLNLDFQPILGGDLRLSVWEDGLMWLRLCVAALGRNAGWAFIDSFYGSINDVSAAALVLMVEATMAEPFRVGNSDVASYRDQLRKIWGRVQRADDS